MASASKRYTPSLSTLRREYDSAYKSFKQFIEVDPHDLDTESSLKSLAADLKVSLKTFLRISRDLSEKLMRGCHTRIF